MKILKKNQLAVLVISLMLITAGYLNYDASIKGIAAETSSDIIDVASIGDATLVNANITEDEEKIDTEKNNEDEIEAEETSEEIKEEKEEAEDDYFVKSKLERNVMYSQMIERYKEILQNANTLTDQRMIAEQEINDINNIQNAIMITENLLTTKGFEKNIVFVNKESISVIIGKEELTADEIAQIQNIISRELEAEVENIHISLK